MQFEPSRVLFGLPLSVEAEICTLFSETFERARTWPVVTGPLSVAFRVMLTWFLLDVITDALEFEMV
jgi:hypothetical protein